MVSELLTFVNNARNPILDLDKEEFPDLSIVGTELKEFASSG